MGVVLCSLAGPYHNVQEVRSSGKEIFVVYKT
jgi:hypothetical protein